MNSYRSLALWHYVCLDLNITKEWIREHGARLCFPMGFYHTDMQFRTYDAIYSCIVKMACRVTNLRIKRTALAHLKSSHSHSKYARLAQPALKEAYDAFMNLSTAERHCYEAQTAFGRAYRQEADFRWREESSAALHNRPGRPPSPEPAADGSTIRNLKRNTMTAQLDFQYWELVTCTLRLNVFICLHKLYNIEHCLTTALHKPRPTDFRRPCPAKWRFNAKAVVRKLDEYHRTFIYDYRIIQLQQARNRFLASDTIARAYVENGAACTYELADNLNKWHFVRRRDKPLFSL